MNPSPPSPKNPDVPFLVRPPKRLLVIRLDRIGDVAISTSVITAARQAWPQAFIAMLVRTACREIIEGHPYLNAAFFYDKEGLHQKAWDTFLFAQTLRRFRFDTALVLHPSTRSHAIPFLAGIPRRIGYNRKDSWMLTRRLPHRKQEGEKHEAEYALDMLRVFGIDPGPPKPVVPLDPLALSRVEGILKQGAWNPSLPLVAIHPSASCVSKRWMPERFAAVADRLVESHGAQIVLVASKEDAVHADAVMEHMSKPVLNFAGRLPLRELVAFFSRCNLLISNDSGPVHLAAAVGTRVVDIFGRNQAGLSPRRWGPIGEGHIVLHKEVGCDECLAHNCQIEFKCLKELSVDEVYQAAVSVLQP